MMHARIIWLIIALVAFGFRVEAATSARPMSNNDVVAMMQAKLPEQTIVSAIQQSPADFDTSPSALIALKEKGASAAVLDAILATTTPANAPIVAMDVAGTIVAIDGDQQIPLRRAIGGITTNKGTFFRWKHRNYIFFNGVQSHIRLTQRAPSFHVSIAGNVHASEQITLIRLTTAPNQRRTEMIADYTGMDVSYGGTVPIKVGAVEGGSAGMSGALHRVSADPLTPGEYVLLYQGAFYDFGID